MDRRDFLKTTSAAAVAASAASASTAAATEAAPNAPAIRSGSRQLTLKSYSSDLPGSGADRLARRIEIASDGRYRIELVESADADLTYGSAWRHASLHRAFAVFAGLPFSQGLDAAALQTWLAAGGGAMLWDELAAEHGFKPLVAGHTGPSPGVWSTARLETPSDLAGASLQVEGLAGDILRDLGATAAEFAPEDLRAALADGRLQAAEWLGPLAAAAPDLQPLAQRLYQPGFNRHGQLLSLGDRQAPLGRHERRRPGDLRGLRHRGVSSLADRRSRARLDRKPSRNPRQVAGPAGMAERHGRGLRPGGG